MTISGRQKHGRTIAGQAIAEGVVFLILLSALGVGLVLLVLNSGVISSNQQKLQAVANEAANYIATDKFWLGMERTGFNLETSKANARATAALMLSSLGLGEMLPGDAGFKVVDNLTVTVGTPPKQQSFAVVRVDIAIPSNLAGGWGSTTLNASGVSSSAAEAKANIVGSMYFYNPGNPADGAAFYMPLYGLVKNSQVTGDNSETGEGLPGIPKMGSVPNSMGFATVNVTLAGYAQHNAYSVPGGTEASLATVGNAQKHCMYNPPYIPPTSGPPGDPGPRGPSGSSGPAP